MTKQNKVYENKNLKQRLTILQKTPLKIITRFEEIDKDITHTVWCSFPYPFFEGNIVGSENWEEITD